MNQFDEITSYTASYFAEMTYYSSAYESSRQRVIYEAKGYRVELGEDEADFMWYQNEFKNDYKTGKVSERTVDLDDENNVSIPE